VDNQRGYPNYHQSDYPKMTDPQEDFQGEDSQEAEDFQVEEYQEEEEDTPEEEDRLEPDHQEEVGDPHPSKYLSHKQES